MATFFIAARSVGSFRCIPLASSRQVERRGFWGCSGPNPGRPKLSVFRHDLLNLADLGGFSGNLSNPTFFGPDRRWLISGGLEQTRRFFPKTLSESCCARSDRTLGCCNLLAFIRSCLLRNEHPVRFRLHVFRNLDFLADNSVVLLPGNLTERTEGGYLWNFSRDKRFPPCFAEAKFHADISLCSGVRNLVDTDC